MPFREPRVLHGIPKNALAFPDTSREGRAASCVRPLG